MNKGLKTTLGLMAGGVLGGLAGKQLVSKKLQAMKPANHDAAASETLLYQFAYSPYCAKSRYCLDYKGLPYTLVELTPVIHSQFSRQLTGQTKVPYLRHKGSFIADSSAIAHYLDSEFPDKPLLPTDPVLREQVLLLEDWLDEALVPALARLAYVHYAQQPEIVINDPNLSMGLPALEPYKAWIVPVMLQRSLLRLGASVKERPRLEARVNELFARLKGLSQGKDHLVGDSLTLADLTLAAHLSVTERLPFMVAAPEHQWLPRWRQQILAQLQAESQTQNQILGHN